jgi:hypothetical protein
MAIEVNRRYPIMHAAYRKGSEVDYGATSSPPLRYFFFGSGFVEVWLMTNDFTRLNSFLNPGTKSLVPYSKRTTKLKVKNRNRTTQKIVRSNCMAETVTYSCCMVNVPRNGGQVRV